MLGNRDGGEAFQTARIACAKAPWREGPGTFEHPVKCQFPLSVSWFGLRKELMVRSCPLSSLHVTQSQEGGGDRPFHGWLAHRGSWAWWSLGGGRDDAHVGTQEVLVEEEGFEHWKGPGDHEKRVRCMKLQGQGGAGLSKGLRFSSVGQLSLNHEPRMMWSDLRWGHESWVPLGNSLLTPMSCL